ncbi:MAG: hypothetical protein AB7F89_05020, partial [Pirellulaceae bacterium]
MPQLRARVVESLSELAADESKWNELWQRSAATSPVLRLAGLTNWLTTFAPRDRFRAVVVEDGNTFVAALPMVERRWARVIRTGATPCNEWSLAGDLLLDTSTDGRAT